MNRERLVYLIVVACCIWVLKPLAVPLVSGMILAFLCETPVNRLFAYLQISAPRSRWLASLGFVSLVQLLFIAPLIYLTWTATELLFNFWNGWSEDHNALETGFKLLAWLDGLVTPILADIGVPWRFSDLNGKLRDLLQPILKGAALYLGSALRATPQLILLIAVTWMAWVYFLVHGQEQRQKYLPRLLPWDEERQLLAKTLAEVLKALVLTSIVLSVVQSLLVVLALGIVGIPKFYLWGALSFFLSFVPVVGTAPVMLISALYCFNQGQGYSAVFIVATAVLIGLVDNILRPLLMKSSSELNFFWTTLAIVGGIGMFGLPGVILGPWAFSLFLAVNGQKPLPPVNPVS